MSEELLKEEEKLLKENEEALLILENLIESFNGKTTLFQVYYEISKFSKAMKDKINLKSS